jgi:hypothetical protein
MTTSLVRKEDANSYIKKVPEELFGVVLGFLEPQDLDVSERVCKSWNERIESQGQWKIQCQNLCNLSPETDLRSCVPEASSYKEICQMVYLNIFGKSVYERYIGKVGSVPRIPNGLPFLRWNKPDPCDPTKRIGPEYVWMYIPSHIEIHSEAVALSKIDDPNDEEAPRLLRLHPFLRLLRRKAGLEESVSGTRSVLKVKVPVTINNIKILFENPKEGNPSTYSQIWDKIAKQHGNKRWTAGWVCMRKDATFRNLTFADQQALAAERGVALSELLPRILFNCLGHVRSGTANIYPDGQNPWTYVRTSTLTRGGYGDNDWPSGCGDGCPSGLCVSNDDIFDGDVIGAAVVLPEEV